MQVDDADWTVHSTVVDSLSCTLKDLLRGRRYRFRVRAENCHGCSAPSDPTEAVHISAEAEPARPEQRAARVNGSASNADCMDNGGDDDGGDGRTIEVPTVREGGDFRTRFETFEELGKGRFGTVYKCVERETGATLAAKIVKCIRSTDKTKARKHIKHLQSGRSLRVLYYVSIDSRGNHNHAPAPASEAPASGRRLRVSTRDHHGHRIVSSANREQISSYIERVSQLHFSITGGELFERVVADDFTLTEHDCQLFMRQICEAVDYMHTQHVVHLDLKPENIMCQDRSSHKVENRVRSQCSNGRYDKNGCNSRSKSSTSGSPSDSPTTRRCACSSARPSSYRRRSSATSRLATSRTCGRWASCATCCEYSQTARSIRCPQN